MADESCAGAVVRGLREDGHQVNYVGGSRLSGIEDVKVMRIADEACQIVITEDSDFGELVFRVGIAARGVIFVRLGGARPEEKLRRVREGLEREQDRIEGSFIVIGPNRDRVRALPSAAKPPNLPGSD